MNKKSSVILISVFILMIGKSLFAADWWDKDWQYRRKISFTRTNQMFSKSEGGRAFVDVPGRAFADARDVKVVSETGKLLKSQIIWSDESDQIEIICELGDSESAYVYWGNKKAKKQDKSEIYDPKFGLYLETWKKPEGSFSTWEQVQALFEKSKKIYGRTIHLKVHDRFNRFGPSDNYLSHYYGWLNCLENGKYKFYTASDDASFLLIDNTMVVQWAGRHTAWEGTHGKHFGTIKLEKGKHRFDYFHVEDTADQACVAGWRLPSKFNDEIAEGEILVIQPHHFGGFVEGYSEPTEILGEKIVADFKHIAVSDLYMTESDAIVKVQFKADIFGKEHLVGKVKYAWDFGDGNDASGESVAHSFLTSGFYDVELKIMQAKDVVAKCKIKVKILPIWDQNSRFNENSAKYFWNSIKDHKLEKISLAGLRNYYAVCDMVSNEDGKLKALRSIVKHIGEFKDNEKPLIYLELAELEAYIAKDSKRCTELLELAGKSTKSDAMLISIKLKTAELLFKAFEKTKESLEILQALEKESKKLSVFQKKELYLLFGDLSRLNGKLDDARKYYENVMKAGNSSDVEETQIADWRMRILSYVQQGYPDAAVSLVQDWRWRNPTSYLDHDLAYLEIKALIASGKVAKAEAQAKILIKGQPDNIYAGDCLWDLAEYFIKYKIHDKAKAYLTVLIEKYKEHPRCQDAAEIIKTLK